MTKSRQPVDPRSRQLTIGLIALVMALLTSNSARAQKITTEFDESVDFSKFKTFAVREGQLNTKSPALGSELTRKRIETEIERALTARGLSKATGPSDLNVFFSFGAMRRMETEAYPAGWRGLRTRVVRTATAEGTLVVDLRDPATRSLVWRGIAVEDERNPEKLSEKLDDMVRKAIDKYPPKK